MSQVKEIIAFQDSSGEIHTDLDAAINQQIYINDMNRLAQFIAQPYHDLTNEVGTKILQFIIDNKQDIIGILCNDDEVKHNIVKLNDEI